MQPLPATEGKLGRWPRDCHLVTGRLGRRRETRCRHCCWLRLGSVAQIIRATAAKAGTRSIKLSITPRVLLLVVAGPWVQTEESHTSPGFGFEFLNKDFPKPKLQLCVFLRGLCGRKEMGYGRFRAG